MASRGMDTVQDELTKLLEDRPVQSSRVSIDEILSRPVSGDASSKIESLPQELCLEVLARLPLESQACLILTCRTLAIRLHSQYWCNVRDKRYRPAGALLQYLVLVLRDRPDLYCCYTCCRLYAIDKTIHKCLEDQSNHQFVVRLGPTPFGLRFGDLQLVMTQYRRDGQKSHLHKLHRNTARFRPTLRYRDKVAESEARYDLSSGHLLIRAQRMSSVDYSHGSASFEMAMLLTKPLCGNWGHEDFRYQSRDPEIVSDCPHDHHLPTECMECGFKPCCNHCPTEFSIQKFHIGLDRRVIVITLWKDLGTVSSPTDRVWRAHTEPRSIGDRGSKEFKNMEWTNQQLQLADVRKRYESQAGITVEELTQLNLQRWNAGKRAGREVCFHNVG